MNQIFSQMGTMGTQKKNEITMVLRDGNQYAGTKYMVIAYFVEAGTQICLVGYL